MKHWLLLPALLCANIASAQTTANFTLSSGYIWRGLSFSSAGGSGAQNAPVVQGSFDYATSSGLGLNLFVGNSDSVNYDTSPNRTVDGSTVEADHEFDPTISYTFDLGSDFKVWLAATAFLYVKNASNNTTDLQAALMWKAVRLDLSYIDNFFGTKSSANHIRLGLRDAVNEKTGYFASVGTTSFDKENLVGYKGYVDYKVGLYQTSGSLTTEIYFTDTTRKNLSDTDLHDAAAIAALSIAFN